MPRAVNVSNGPLKFNARNTRGVGMGLVLLAILVFFINLAILLGSVALVIVNIIDIANVGPNFWNIFWIALGAIIFFGTLSSRN